MYNGCYNIKINIYTEVRHYLNQKKKKQKYRKLYN